MSDGQNLSTMFDEAFTNMCRRQHERREHMIAADASPDDDLDASKLDPKVLTLMGRYVALAKKVLAAERVLEKKEAHLMAQASRDLRFAADADTPPVKPKDGDGDRVMAALDKISKRLDAIEGKAPKGDPVDIDDDDGLDDQDVATPGPLDKKPNPAAAIPGSEGEPAPVASDNRRRADSASARRLRLAELQAKYDRVCGLWGTAASRPLDGESPRGFRQRSLRQFQRYHPQWANVALDDLDPATFKVAEAQIIDSAREAAKNPTVPSGTLLSRVRHDDVGRKITEFFGSPSVWLNRGARPRQYLQRIATPGELRHREMFGLITQPAPSDQM
jgi:hypothetical protein